jgi:hypothetical protein
MDDGLFEGDETLSVALANPTGGAVLGQQKATQLTILDNELRPRLLDIGFQPDRVLMVSLQLPPKRYTTWEQRVAFTQSVLERVAAMPGAQSAQVTLSMTDAPPAGVTVITFEVSVTSATLYPGNVDLLAGKGPVRIEVKKLETESAFLSTASITPASFTQLNLTFANPELTFMNNTGANLAGCANSSYAVKTQNQTLQQQQVVLQQRNTELQTRASALDHDNQELETLLARTRDSLHSLPNTVTIRADRTAIAARHCR